ncbi:monooxygenase [Penicillium malachiteum]|uniref:monooxygenase n=1 Tax=Penicillium malachiteum TaxID=1324776 RepID=UPI0025473720|nr:monooxygenase [Penicillium malachiteum]KAJ5726098.1 monooxygenase [Penicillium malachiteum]
MAEDKKRFRVIIVGGSVAGLTLAHCLLKSNIDFVVLESHDDIAPAVGASIGIMANGARILDQLGMFDDVLDAVAPLSHSMYFGDSGNLLASSDGPKIVEERHGYPITFLDRQTLLQIFYTHLEGDQEKVLTGKRVIQVDHHSTGVVAHCEDGSSYEGDLIVGADGVRSTVRKLMWNHMESAGLRQQVEKERTTMTSEYDCVFGISDPLPGLIPRQSYRTFGEGYSILVIASKDGRVYWFFFTKMDRKYLAHEIPRFSQQDIHKHMAQWLHKPVTSSVTLGDVYNNASVKTHLALEEANFQLWCKDRWVCIGDSIHKMTPNAGYGGNSAIESAASLTNYLTQLLQHNASPETEDIDMCLTNWQTHRQVRLAKVWQSSHDLTRLEACETFKDRIIALHLLRFLSNTMINRGSAIVVGAERVESLPLPSRSLRGTMPFLNGVEITEQPPAWERGLRCLPLLACLGAAGATMIPSAARFKTFMGPIFAQGLWTAKNGDSFSLQRQISPFSFLDKLLKPYITCFLPSISGHDPVSRVQMLSFITDLGAVYGIWLLDNYRISNGFTDALLPITVGVVVQLKGAGIFAPVYYILDHLRAPISRLISGGGHEVNAKTAISVVVGLLAGYYLPSYQGFTTSTLQSRGWWNAVWQVFPIAVPVIAGISSRIQGAILKNHDKPEQAKRQESSRNMTTIRCTYIGLAAISGLTWIHALRSAPAGASISSIFWPGMNPHSTPVTSFVDGIAHFLKYDQLWFMASGFVSLGLRLEELKQRGANFSWFNVTSSLVGATVALGPGSAFVLGWGWKEELLNRLSLRSTPTV